MNTLSNATYVIADPALVLTAQALEEVNTNPKGTTHWVLEVENGSHEILIDNEPSGDIIITTERLGAFHIDMCDPAKLDEAFTTSGEIDFHYGEFGCVIENHTTEEYIELEAPECFSDEDEE